MARPRKTVRLKSSDKAREIWAHADILRWEDYEASALVLPPWLGDARRERPSADVIHRAMALVMVDGERRYSNQQIADKKPFDKMRNALSRLDVMLVEAWLRPDLHPGEDQAGGMPGSVAMLIRADIVIARATI
jgi:hypothetical protein